MWLYFDLTMTVIMMGSPKEISLVDSIRITVRLMVILTTPPRKAAAPMRAYVPEEIFVSTKNTLGAAWLRYLHTVQYYIALIIGT